MAQTGYTPLLIYASGTATNVPLAANLTSSASGAELALNYADGKLYFKNSSGVVTLLASSATVAPVTTLSFGTTGLTPSTATSGAITVAGTLATTNGGTGLTSFTANGVVYASSSSALTTGSALTFDGTTLFTSRTTDGVIFNARGTSNAQLLLSVNSGVLQYDASNGSAVHAFLTNASEQMRLTSTGLGIGTSSPSYKLDVRGVAAAGNGTIATALSFDTNGLVGTVSNHSLGILINSVVVARFDTSGNLGLGVTPSAWVDDKALQLPQGSVSSGYEYGISVAAGAYRSASNVWRYTQSAAGVSRFNQVNGAHEWYIAPSGTAGNAISFTQAMTLDASGNLLVGGTSALVSAVGRGNITVNGSTDAVLSFGSAGTNTGYLYATTSGLELASIGSTFVRFSTNGLERARITSGGNFLVGTTDDSTANKFVINGTMSFVNGATIPQVNYYSSASTIEFVNRDSGGAKTFSWYYGASGGGSPATLSTSGVWTNASDARGKENIASIHYGLDAVMALTPRQYDVKSDGSHAIGFVAQEVLPIIPELVHVTKRDNENEFYGLDYGSMTAVLVKAIQELKAEFDAYKATHP